MKYALIGCGRIATNHVKAVKLNNLEFVAACDLELDNIQKLLENMICKRIQVLQGIQIIKNDTRTSRNPIGGNCNI